MQDKAKLKNTGKGYYGYYTNNNIPQNVTTIKLNLKPY